MKRRRIHKKTWPEEFHLLKSKRKNIELRLADFKLRQGDVLVLEEWDPKQRQYTGRTIERKVGLVLKFNLAKWNPVADIKKYGHYLIWLDD
ncbi:MAG: DUF3850 domain-containing protein [Candidatus Kerfeldbacteria bacterium]|nr:DUF3850 domain-containing protein [Candidatus Kerfeldbacteria bacterium]